jgi:hypothetical protein
MMKKVFMLCVLAAGMLLQSCGEEGLTGLSVNYKRDAVLTVGETLILTATLEPAGADATLVWTSSNESVAGVSGDVLTVNGVGKSVITVSSGSLSASFNLEGSVRSVTLTAPEGTEIEVGARFQLTATIDPAGFQVSPVWSSDNEAVATVSASGEVAVLGNGTANIHATVGSIIGVYTVVCEDMLASAIGYWEFDDRSDIGKATYGNPLKQEGAGIRWVEGPSAENLAIEVPMHEYFVANLTNATPNGPTPGRVYRWSMMIDFRVPNVRNYYYTQHGGVNMDDGDLFIRIRDNYLQAGGPSTYVSARAENPDNAYIPWTRAVLTYDNCVLRMYVDGKEIPEQGGYPMVWGLSERHTLPVGNLVIFGEPKGTTEDGKPNFANSDDDNPFPCAAIAFWDIVLNPGQVESLGRIDH